MAEAEILPDGVNAPPMPVDGAAPAGNGPPEPVENPDPDDIDAFVLDATIAEIEDAVQQGRFSARDIVTAERRTRGSDARKGVLALVD